MAVRRWLAAAMLGVPLTASGAGGLPPPDDNPLRPGIWEGRVSWAYTPNHEGRPIDHSHLVLNNCGPLPEISIRRDNGRISLLTKNPVMSSYKGTHIVRDFGSSRGGDNGWVQSFAWTFFEIEEGRLVLSHMRSVNNRGVSASDPLRYYFAYGTGILEPSTGECGPK